MSQQQSFGAMWERAAQDRALLPNTIDSYWTWARHFWRFLKRPASTWEAKDWEAFERHLIAEKYSSSARRQARSALNFIFRYALKKRVGKLDLPRIRKPSPALVVVPTREELGRIFTNLKGLERIACRIMHGGGTRREETVHIRVQDVDLARARLRVWDGKGAKNRETVLPRNLLPALAQLIEWRRCLHERDLADGNGFVWLPDRLARKYRGAAREFGWQFLLASSVVEQQRRWHISADTVGSALRLARLSAGIVKRVVCHSLRKAFASECAQAGMDIRTIQALLGHASMETTATHYLAIDLQGAFSPADIPTVQLRPVQLIAQREVLRLAA